jgi:tRNA threonylcarbamoyladenosine biosynthesis protein TsaE
MQIKTCSPEQTRKAGQRLGELLESGTGTVIALTGELGSGKTLFVKGIADGLGNFDGDEVSSPSFALIHEYPSRIPLFHVDLYRIDRIQEIEDLGLEEIFQRTGVTAVEWADRIDQKLLEEYIHVKFEIIDDDYRSITLTGFGDRFLKILKCFGEEMIQRWD